MTKPDTATVPDDPVLMCAVETYIQAVRRAMDDAIPRLAMGISVSRNWTDTGFDGAAMCSWSWSAQVWVNKINSPGSQLVHDLVPRGQQAAALTKVERVTRTGIAALIHQAGTNDRGFGEHATELLTYLLDSLRGELIEMLGEAR